MNEKTPSDSHEIDTGVIDISTQSLHDLDLGDQSVLVQAIRKLLDRSARAGEAFNFQSAVGPA